MTRRNIKHIVLILALSIATACLLLQASFTRPIQSIAKPVKHTISTSGVHNSLTITPQTSNDVLINPGMGWVLYGPPSDHTASTIAYASVGYVRYSWTSIEPTEGKYNWSLIDNDLNAWAAQGKQFAFGVMNADSSDWSTQYVTPKWVFDDGAASVQCKTFDNLTGNTGVQYEPVWDNPIFLQKERNFLAALAQRYDSNPNIAYIDVRSYGNYGEGHVYGIPPSVPLSAAGVQSHIQMYKDAFKHVQIIVPWGAPEDNSAYDWAVNNGVGMRRDGIMVDSNGSDVARAYGKEPSVYEFYGSYQWLVANGYWNDMTLRNDINIGRPNYVSMGQWGDDAQVMLANEGPLIRELANKMGYHFVLTSATIPTSMSNKSTTNISLSWSNQGVSYLYKQAGVAVALLDSSNKVVQKQWLAGSNPGTWAPGQTTTQNAAITFNGVSAGTYRLAVGLFQNTSDANPTYKIGNQGRTPNGWYVLSNNVIFSGAVVCPITIGFPVRPHQLHAVPQTTLLFKRKCNR